MEAANNLPAHDQIEETAMAAAHAGGSSTGMSGATLANIAMSITQDKISLSIDSSDSGLFPERVALL